MVEGRADLALERLQLKEVCVSAVGTVIATFASRASCRSTVRAPSAMAQSRC